MFSEVDSANLENANGKPSKHKVAGKAKGKAKKMSKKKHHAKKIAAKK